MQKIKLLDLGLIKLLQKQQGCNLHAPRCNKSRYGTKHDLYISYVIRCFKCGEFGAASYDLRKINGIHHVTIDETFPARTTVDTSNHKSTNFDGMATDAAIKCKKCCNKWGTRVRRNGMPWHLLRIEGFNIYDSQGNIKGRFKKWSAAHDYFTVAEFVPGDEKALAESLLEESTAAADETTAASAAGADADQDQLAL